MQISVHRPKDNRGWSRGLVDSQHHKIGAAKNFLFDFTSSGVGLDGVVDDFAVPGCSSEIFWPQFERFGHIRKCCVTLVCVTSSRLAFDNPADLQLCVWTHHWLAFLHLEHRWDPSHFTDSIDVYFSLLSVHDFPHIWHKSMGGGLTSTRNFEEQTQFVSLSYWPSPLILPSFIKIGEMACSAPLKWLGLKVAGQDTGPERGVQVLQKSTNTTR